MVSPFFGPVLALVTLTMVVWVLAVTRRVGEVRARRIPLQTFARARDTANALQDTQATDNFNNLMQVPVLFYVLCLALVQIGESGTAFVIGAWAYVLLRVLHSAIQTTYNLVLHRFYVWVLGNLVLFTLWGAFAFRLFHPGA